MAVDHWIDIVVFPKGTVRYIPLTGLSLRVEPRVSKVDLGDPTETAP